MYYILNDNFGLRYYNDIGYCIISKYRNDYIKYILEDEFIFLNNICDGTHDIVDINDKLAYKFFLYDIIVPQEYKRKQIRSPWQIIETDNDFHMEMEIAITQRCNYNCKYCFETADDSPLDDAFTIEEFTKLIDDALLCGINCVALTGGEPMIHKDFLEIVKIIDNKELGVSEIMTNGSLISEKMLDELKNLKACKNTKFCISFDGINGKHDSIRQTKSEKIVIDNIKKCIDHGFNVKVTYNLSKFNIEELKDTTILINDLNVGEFRIARTMPAPKWNLFAPGTEIEHKEWYDIAIEYTKWYINSNNNMYIDFWNACQINPANKTITLNAIRGCGNDEADNKKILCPLTKQRICICGDGLMVPCHQVSGILRLQGINLGNVKTEGLPKILKDSKWKDTINIKVTDRLKNQNECKKCKYWSDCLGGCPIICWKWRHDIDTFPFYTDITRCTFFKNGYVQKFISELLNDTDWVIPLKNKGVIVNEVNKYDYI